MDFQSTFTSGNTPNLCFLSTSKNLEGEDFTPSGVTSLTDSSSLELSCSADETVSLDHEILPKQSAKRKSLSAQELEAKKIYDLAEESRIQTALKEMKENGISSREAAKRNNVKRSTLYARSRGVEKTSSEKHGHRIFSDVEELTLKNYLLKAAVANRIYDKHEIKEMATKMYRAKTDDPSVEAGDSWLRGFKNRNIELKLVPERNMKYKVSLSQRPHVIINWCGLIKGTMERYNILPQDFFNFDVSGFLMDESKKAKVVTRTNFREDPSLVSSHGREWVTAFECISAAGRALPPYIIFKGKNLLLDLFEDLNNREDWRFDNSSTGWPNDEANIQWLKRIFLPHAAKREGEYVLLVFDGSHYTSQFSEICEMNKIIILCMPLNSSHNLQPLDVCCFPKLKEAWQQINQRRAERGKNFIMKKSFIKIYHKARMKAFTQENIIRSFLKAGLQPLDAGKVIAGIGCIWPPSSEIEKPATDLATVRREIQSSLRPALGHIEELLVAIVTKSEGESKQLQRQGKEAMENERVVKKSRKNSHNAS